MNDKLARVDAAPTHLAAVPEEIGISIEDIIARVNKIHAVQKRVMKEGVHYGVIPGTDKPALLKPGAEMLCMTFQLDPQFALDERHEGNHLEVVVTCTLYHSPTGARLGSGIGSCSTKEGRYAYRKGERTCPSCGKATIIKGKAEYGGGWLCFAKKGGCNAKFGDKDPAITGQQTGRVDNPDIPDLYNTVRKMACKRAHVAACLFVTGGSELFTQDIEEDAPARDEGPHSPHDDGLPPSDTLDPNIAANLLERMSNAKAMLATCDSYDKALAIRALIGSQAKQSQLTKDVQFAKEGRLITPDEHKELSKIWQHVNRQATKLEKEFAPPVEASFSDDPEPEAHPDDDGR
jgi:hypothetical protein